MNEAGCPFCDIIRFEAPATIVKLWPDAIAIVPLNPIVTGHLLVIPTTHVADLTTDPAVSAAAFQRAAEIAAPPCNVITSAGWQATQTVFHLHLHMIPRAENDGLALPWYSGRSRQELLQ